MYINFIEQRRSELLGTEYGILGNKEISSIKTNSICFNWHDCLIIKVFPHKWQNEKNDFSNYVLKLKQLF